jgi:hypothetical protein
MTDGPGRPAGRQRRLLVQNRVRRRMARLVLLLLLLRPSLMLEQHSHGHERPKASRQLTDRLIRCHGGRARPSRRHRCPSGNVLEERRFGTGSPQRQRNSHHLMRELAPLDQPSADEPAVKAACRGGGGGAHMPFGTR